MRRKPLRLSLGIMLALLALVLFAGCGQGQKVGSEKLLEFEEQENAKRLGEAEKSPSPAGEQEKAALGEPSKAPSPTPEAQENFYTVELIAASPYFRAEGQDASHFIVPVGLTLRVINRDTTAERPTRSFTAEDGSFDSGSLASGQTWTTKLTRRGTFRVVDRCCPFIFGTLEVS